MLSIADLVEETLDFVAGRSFDPRLVGGNVIDLGPLAERVRDLASRLNAHRDGKPKQALVLWTEGYSAVTKRGPWVYVARGLAEKLDDDALAFVLAHEMGHHDLRHLSPALVAAGMLGEWQRMEFAADRYGFELATRAGFDGSGALTALDPGFWGAEPRVPDDRLPPKVAAWVDRFRHSHPPLEERCDALRGLLAA